MILPSPRQEARRLAALCSHDVMHAAADPGLEGVTRLAARFFAMPMVAVSFVDEYRVRYAATHGLPPHESAREASLCARAIFQKDVLVVRDARTDARFKGLSFDPGPNAIRFYAGAALRTAEGHALGTLCVMDTSPREFTREDEGTLADMASFVMDKINLRRLAGHLRAETFTGRQSQRALTRQQHLLRRLGDTLEDRVRVRTEEAGLANASLRAEIAHRERTEAALRQAKEEAERANAAKSEFLARLCHELRTPLNAVLGFGQILRGPLPAAEQHDCACHVVAAGRHLLSLIDDVLDTARIEAGREDLSLEPVQVCEVVGEALDLVRPLAAARHLTLAVPVAGRGAQTVLADRRRLKQALLNLLSNAVKYSPESGRIVVACRVERTRTVRLSVTDEGPGMTREQAERLFVAFDRLGAEHSEIPGTGLGLSLSKRFVEAMGGTVGVTTAPGRGSTFWVRLPLSEPATAVVRETPAPEIYAQRPPAIPEVPGTDRRGRAWLIPPRP